MPIELVIPLVVTVVILEYYDSCKIIIVYFISSFHLYVECLYIPKTDGAGAQKLDFKESLIKLGQKAQRMEWKQFEHCNSKVCIT